MTGMLWALDTRSPIAGTAAPEQLPCSCNTLFLLSPLKVLKIQHQLRCQIWLQTRAGFQVQHTVKLRDVISPLGL